MHPISKLNNYIQIGSLGANLIFRPLNGPLRFMMIIDIRFKMATKRRPSLGKCLLMQTTNNLRCCNEDIIECFIFSEKWVIL